LFSKAQHALPPGEYSVFCGKEADLRKNYVHFVCRLKSNAVYQVLDTTFDQSIPKNTAGVLKEQIIQIVYKDEEGKEKNFYTEKKSFAMLKIESMNSLPTISPYVEKK
jgi:hypothetical protein